MEISRNINHRMEKISGAASAEQKLLLLNVDVRKPFPQQTRETVWRMMLRHEKIFQNQVHELHRLYKVQRMMTNGVNHRTSSHVLPASPHASLGLSSEVKSINQTGCKRNFWHSMEHPVFTFAKDSDTNLLKQTQTSKRQHLEGLMHSEKATISIIDDAGYKINHVRKKIIDLEKPPEDDTEDEVEDWQGFNMSAESMTSLRHGQPAELILRTEADPSRRFTDKMLFLNKTYQTLNVSKSIGNDKLYENLSSGSPRNEIKCTQAQEVVQHKLPPEENNSSSSFAQGASVSRAGIEISDIEGNSAPSSSGQVILIDNVDSKHSNLDLGMQCNPYGCLHFADYQHPEVIQTEAIDSDRQVPWLESAVQLFHGDLHPQQPVYSTPSGVKTSQNLVGVPIDQCNVVGIGWHDANISHIAHSKPFGVRPLKLVLVSDDSGMMLHRDKGSGEPLAVGTSKSEIMTIPSDLQDEENMSLTDETTISKSIINTTSKPKQGGDIAVVHSDQNYQDNLFKRASLGTERSIQTSPLFESMVSSVCLDQNSGLRAQLPGSSGSSETDKCSDTIKCESNLQGHTAHMNCMFDGYSTEKSVEVSGHINQHVNSTSLNTDPLLKEQIESSQDCNHSRTQENLNLVAKSSQFPLQGLQKISETEQSYSAKALHDGIVPCLPNPLNPKIKSLSNMEKGRLLLLSEEEEQMGFIAKTVQSDWIVPLLPGALNTETKTISNMENDDLFVASEKEEKPIRAQQECGNHFNSDNSHNKTLSNGCKSITEKMFHLGSFPDHGSISTSCRNNEEKLNGSWQIDKKKDDVNSFQMELLTQKNESTSPKVMHFEGSGTKEQENTSSDAKKPFTIFNSHGESSRNLVLYMENFSATIQKQTVQVDQTQSDSKAGVSEDSRSHVVEEVDNDLIGHHNHHNNLSSKAIFPKEDIKLDEDSSQYNMTNDKNNKLPLTDHKDKEDAVQASMMSDEIKLSLMDYKIEEVSTESNDAFVQPSLPQGDDDCHSTSLAASILLSFAPSDCENDKPLSKSDAKKFCRKPVIKVAKGIGNKTRQLNAVQNIVVFNSVSSRTELDNGTTECWAHVERQTQRLNSSESVTLIPRSDSIRKRKYGGLRSDSMAHKQQIAVSNSLPENFKTPGDEISDHTFHSKNQELLVLSRDERIPTYETTAGEDAHIKDNIVNSTSSHGGENDASHRQRMEHKSYDKRHKWHYQSKVRKAVKRVK